MRVPLGEVADVRAGVGFPERLQGRREGDCPFFKVGDISRAWLHGRRWLVEADHYVSESDMESERWQPIPAGATVFAKIGAAVALNRRALLGRQALIDNNCFAVVPRSPEVDPQYLYHFMCSVDLGQLTRATTVPSLRKNDVETLQILRVDPVVQAEIVATLDAHLSRLDAAVASLTRAKANVANARASVLKAAVEGRLVPTEAELARVQGRTFEHAAISVARQAVPPRPNRYSTRSTDVIPGHAALSVGETGTALPAGWVRCPMVDVARMESGHTPSRGHPEWWSGDVPWIGLADAREHHGGQIQETLQHTNADGLANSAARLLPAGTVCLSRTASVGYVVVMGRPMATSQDFVNWVCTPALSPEWVRTVFMADRQALRRFGKGSVHTTIYFPELLSLHIAVPPLAEQRRIVAEVDRRLSVLDGIERVVDANLARSSRVRQAILKRAFEGRLVTLEPPVSGASPHHAAPAESAR